MRKRSILTACAFILVLFLLTGCFAINDAKTRLTEANALFDVDYNGEVIRDLRYGEAERNVYDLYLPEDITAPEADHLILFIHGGSWTGGDKKDGAMYCRNYADHGYVAASISYTLKAEGVDTNILKINDEVKAAVSAIKEKCTELGMELEDMAVSGFSAGACQAMMYGFKEASSSALPVRFIIQMSGPTSFEPALWRNGEIHWMVRNQSGLDGSAEGDAAWISLFSGETVTAEMVRNGQAEAIWRKISPFTYVTGSSIPVISAFGSLDGVVPPSSRIVLEKALDDHGVRHDTVVMPNSGHSLACDLDKERELIILIYGYCAEYFN